jgi:manganese oxidase
VREGLASGDYKDPGWFKHPENTVAFEWKGEEKPADRGPSAPAAVPGKTTELQVVKPRRKAKHSGH